MLMMKPVISHAMEERFLAVAGTVGADRGRPLRYDGSGGQRRALTGRHASRERRAILRQHYTTMSPRLVNRLKLSASPQRSSNCWARAAHLARHTQAQRRERPTPGSNRVTDRRQGSRRSTRGRCTRPRKHLSKSTSQSEPNSREPDILCGFRVHEHQYSRTFRCAAQDNRLRGCFSNLTVSTSDEIQLFMCDGFTRRIIKKN